MSQASQGYKDNLSRVDQEMLLIEHVFEKMNKSEYSTDSEISPYVHTPKELCQEKLDKTVENRGNLSGNILVLNPEYISLLLIDRYDTSNSTIYFYTDDVYMKRVVEGILSEHSGAENVKIVVDDTPVDDILGCFFEGNNQDSLTNRDVKMQFDLITGNPPYQTEVGPDKTEPIWNKFVKKIAAITKESGYISIVHPGGWRNVSGKFKDVQNILLSQNIKYLNVNDVDEGLQVFGATTPFDWYVVEKTKDNNSKTTVSTTEDKEVEKNLSSVEFIPNKKFEKVFSLVADEDEETVNVIYSRSNYGTDKEHMSKEKEGEFVHPCVRYVYQDERGIDCWYSNTKENGHFGVPKVMLGQMADTGRITIDEDGSYGLTQWMFAISDEPEVLPKIKEALDSDEFREIMEVCRFNRVMYNRKIVTRFRKDFWKEFI